MACISIRLVMSKLQSRPFPSFNPKFLYTKLHPFSIFKSVPTASRSRHPPVSFSLKRHRVRARHPHPTASAKVTEHPLAPFPRPPSHGLSTSRSANYNSPRSSLSLAPPSGLLCSPPRARSLSTTTFSLNVFGRYIYIVYFCRHNPTLYYQQCRERTS